MDCHGRHVFSDVLPSIEPGKFTNAWFCSECKKFHRLDGPAVIYPNGDERWYLHGKRVTKKDVVAYAKAREEEERRAFNEKVDRESNEGVDVRPMKPITLITKK